MSRHMKRYELYKDGKKIAQTFAKTYDAARMYWTLCVGYSGEYIVKHYGSSTDKDKCTKTMAVNWRKLF